MCKFARFLEKIIMYDYVFRTFIYFLVLICCNIIRAQVGINTNDPQIKLDVAGNMRVRGLVDKSDDASYDRVLTVDANGNVDYTSKASLLPSGNPNNTNKETSSQIYNSAVANGDPSKILKCGNFNFSFASGTDSVIGFSLASDPGKTVNIYMSMEQNWDGSGFQFFQGKTENDGAAVPFTFASSNWFITQSLAQGRVADYEQNVLHFQYPGENDFYRLIIYKVLQNTGTNSWDFAAVCEKF